MSFWDRSGLIPSQRRAPESTQQPIPKLNAKPEGFEMKPLKPWPDRPIKGLGKGAFLVFTVTATEDNVCICSDGTVVDTLSLSGSGTSRFIHNAVAQANVNLAQKSIFQRGPFERDCLNNDPAEVCTCPESTLSVDQQIHDPTFTSVESKDKDKWNDKTDEPPMIDPENPRPIQEIEIFGK